VAVPVLCLTFFLRVCMTVPGSAASLPVARDAGGERASHDLPSRESAAVVCTVVCN